MSCPPSARSGGTSSSGHRLPGQPSHSKAFGRFVTTGVACDVLDAPRRSHVSARRGFSKDDPFHRDGCCLLHSMSPIMDLIHSGDRISIIVPWSPTHDRVLHPDTPSERAPVGLTPGAEAWGGSRHPTEETLDEAAARARVGRDGLACRSAEGPVAGGRGPCRAPKRRHGSCRDPMILMDQSCGGQKHRSCARPADSQRAAKTNQRL